MQMFPSAHQYILIKKIEAEMWIMKPNDAITIHWKPYTEKSKGNEDKLIFTTPVVYNLWKGIRDVKSKTIKEGRINIKKQYSVDCIWIFYFTYINRWFGLIQEHGQKKT